MFAHGDLLIEGSPRRRYRPRDVGLFTHRLGGCDEVRSLTTLTPNGVLALCDRSCLGSRLPQPIPMFWHHCGARRLATRRTDVPSWSAIAVEELRTSAAGLPI